MDEVIVHDIGSEKKKLFRIEEKEEEQEKPEELHNRAETIKKNRV